MSKIADMFKPKCIHRHTEKTHPNCFRDGKPLDPSEKAVKAPKILIFDVETLPLIVPVWQVYDVNVGMNHIIKDWCILSWSAQWVGDDRIMNSILTPSEAKDRDDRRVVLEIWRLLEEADVVVAHNGKRFDIKKLNTRFWYHKLGKPTSYKVIDTLTAARAVFGLTFNKQDFIARFLGLQEKLDTNMQLWLDCDAGNREALLYMQEYNDQDVRMLNDIYMEMRPWITGHPDLRVYTRDLNSCPVCMKHDFENVGLFVADVRRYEEFRCHDCGATWHSSKALKE